MCFSSNAEALLKDVLGLPYFPKVLFYELLEQGRLGIKSGKGFYSDYEEKAPTR